MHPNIIPICTGMVTAQTIAVYFISIDTHSNLLNGAALLITLRYTCMTEECTSMFTTRTMSIHVIYII